MLSALQASRVIQSLPLLTTQHQALKGLAGRAHVTKASQPLLLSLEIYIFNVGSVIFMIKTHTDLWTLSVGMVSVDNRPIILALSADSRVPCRPIKAAIPMGLGVEAGEGQGPSPL